MHGYDAGMVGDMAGILGPAVTYPAANANAPSPFALYLGEDESAHAGNQQDQEPDALMEAVLSLFSLDETELLANGGEEDEEEDVVVDLEDQRLRTDRLRGITLSLDQLWWSGQVYMAAAAEKLADGSRDCKLYISLSNKEELHPETGCMPCPKDFSIMQLLREKLSSKQTLTHLQPVGGYQWEILVS